MTQYNKDFFDRQKDASYASAQAVVPIVLDYVNPKSVVDIGCGVGAWLSVFEEHGIHNVTGIDGDYVDVDQLFISKEKFIPKNLEKPFTINKRADLVMCLEMAEHVYDSSADGLIESLVRIAPIVLFSAAIPLQEGVHHVNEQWPGYWAEKFKKHGYVPVDCIRRKIWTNENIRFWYAQNIFFYIDKKVINKYQKLEQEIKNGNGEALALVHPQKYIQAIERYHSLLPFLKIIPPSIKRVGRRILGFVRRKEFKRLSEK